jgi:type I restriction enzyme S subunit
MSKWYKLGDYVETSLKGITPKYVDRSEVVVLNQKCIRHNKIDYSFSRFHDKDKPFNDLKILKIGDLLFNSTGQGTAGRCAFVRELPEDKIVITDSHILIVRIDDYYLSECFSYLCYNEESLIQKFMDGSTGQGELDKLRLFNLEFKLPDKESRVASCSFLNDLESKIRLNDKLNIELEAMSKLIYNYWFVQFDFPDDNNRPYKASGGKMVYNTKLKREIPEGWQDKTIGDWIEKDKSGDWGKESEQGNYTEQVSCIRGADINGLNGNGVVKAPERFILEKNTHKLLEEGDLIIEMSGGGPTQSTGRMAFITQETLERFENPLICSNFCKAVTLKDETYLYNFVYQWQRLYDAGVLFGWEGKTSGIKNLLFESFVTNYKIVFPKKDIVEKFYQKIKPIHAKKQKNLRENQKLADLRDWLLPMLMNGQVTVKEAQEHINQAAEPQGNYS